MRVATTVLVSVTLVLTACGGGTTVKPDTEVLRAYAGPELPRATVAQLAPGIRGLSAWADAFDGYYGKRGATLELPAGEHQVHLGCVRDDEHFEAVTTAKLLGGVVYRVEAQPVAGPGCSFAIMRDDRLTAMSTATASSEPRTYEPPVLAEPILGSNKVEDAEFENWCKTVPCRKEVRFTLFRGAKQPPFEFQSTLFPPVVADGSVVLVPGERVLIEAREDANGIVDLKVVDSITDPARTLQFEFVQLPGRVDMMLSIKSPFARPLKYSAHMMLLDSKDGQLFYTSSCALHQDQLMREHWGHPIFQIFLGDWRWVESAAAASCD